VSSRLILCLLIPFYSLSWADTAASTFGRLYGSATRKLPARVPYIGLPFAPRKSLAGFTAATLTGAAIAFGFWGLIAPIRNGGRDITWAWTGGVRDVVPSGEPTSLGGGGPLGLLVLSVFAGVVSGVAEALGTSLVYHFFFRLDFLSNVAGRFCRPWIVRR
jgi:diacylglycerol kinase (CTP)